MIASVRYLAVLLVTICQIWVFSIFIDFLQNEKERERERWINLEQKEIKKANDQLRTDLLAQ